MTTLPAVMVVATLAVVVGCTLAKSVVCLADGVSLRSDDVVFTVARRDKYTTHDEWPMDDDGHGSPASALYRTARPGRPLPRPSSYSRSSRPSSLASGLSRLRRFDCTAAQMCAAQLGHADCRYPPALESGLSGGGYNCDSTAVRL